MDPAVREPLEQVPFCAAGLQGLLHEVLHGSGLFRRNIVAAEHGLGIVLPGLLQPCGRGRAGPRQDVYKRQR